MNFFTQQGRSLLLALVVCTVLVGLSGCLWIGVGKYTVSEGFDLVRWGSSVDEVKAAYPSLEEIPLYSNEVKLFRAKNVNAKIKGESYLGGGGRNFEECDFYFVGDRLALAGNLAANSDPEKSKWEAEALRKSLWEKEMTARATWMLNKVEKGENLWDLSVDDVKQILNKINKLGIISTNDRRGDGAVIRFFDNFDEDKTSDYERSIGISRFKSSVAVKEYDYESSYEYNFNFYQNKLYKIETAYKYRGGNTTISIGGGCNNSSFDSNILKINCSGRGGDMTLVNPTTEKQIYIAQGLMYPIYGYDKVEWGADMQTVQNSYKDLKNFPDDYVAYDKTTLKQIIGDGKIIEREFQFYQDKLYFVKVRYNELVRELMEEKLSTTFGKDALRGLIEITQYRDRDWGKALEAGMKMKDAEDYEKRRQITGQGSSSVSLQKGVDALQEMAKAESKTKYFTDVEYRSPQYEGVMKELRDRKNKQGEQKQQDDRQKKLDGLGY